MTGMMTAEADPVAFVAAFEARARRIETPCGDGTMVWRIWGSDGDARRPVVLGHGAQGAWSHWIANIDALAQDRMVIAADLPGHGDSAMPAAQDHPAISAALADGLARILPGAMPVDLVGFSFGGVAFSYLAALNPDVARRVILVGCGGLDTPVGHVDLRPARGLRGEERKAVLRHNLLQLMIHVPAAADDLAIHLLEKNARAARLSVAAELVLPEKLAAILPRVNVPVDAIWGDHDRPHPDPASQEAVIRRTHPDTDFRVIADAGHWVMYEQPGAFNAALLDMLG
jgi:pimeloyl-ACP methyl ester carboxylesterase